MRRLLAIVRGAARLPLVRRLTESALLLRISFSLRASLVSERAAFARNELRRRPFTGVYRLRESGVAVAIRHHTPDVLVLDELFAQREYEPPPAVERVLQGMPTPLHVADLGANIGLFGAWVLERFPEARIVAVEPEPSNASTHREAIAANGLGDRWRLIEACAATAAGTMRLQAGGYSTSRLAETSGDSVEVPAVDVFEELDDVDLLKIDIEGAEWPLLADPRLAALGARALVVEYHPEGSPGADPRAAAENALTGAGYQVRSTGERSEYGTGVLWAWRSA